MRITVSNFQSLGTAQLEVEGLTVLVGPSDRGKSALVRAIEGALFNRAGDQFVRQGTEVAEVTLAWDTHRVVWTKGSGRNQYEIDGTAYAKVGSKVPPALPALGFGEILVGARTKDDGTQEGGEWLRPQIAGQFDRVFLLDRPGAFLSEVIVRLSRLGVLQRAERQCALDLRKTKTTLQLRQTDLAAAVALAERLAEVPALQERVEALVVADSRRAGLAQRRVELEALCAQRRAVLPRLQATMPALPVTREQVQALQRHILALQHQRTALQRRAQLRAVPVKLPKAHKPLAAILKASARYTQLLQLVGQQQMRTTAVLVATHQGELTATAYVTATTALAAARQASPVCPLCRQPWLQEAQDGHRGGLAQTSPAGAGGR